LLIGKRGERGPKRKGPRRRLGEAKKGGGKKGSKKRIMLVQGRIKLGEGTDNLWAVLRRSTHKQKGSRMRKR